MSSSIHRAMLCLASVASLGCKHQAEPAPALNVVVDSSGRYPAIRSAGPAPAWEADSLFSVVSGDAGATPLGTVHSVLLGKGGLLYVVDASNHSVSIYDSTGAFVRPLGGQGEGPGEYRDPYSLGWLSDSLVLLDPRNGRLTIYDSLYRPIGAWPAPSISGPRIRLHRTPTSLWVLNTIGTARVQLPVFVHVPPRNSLDTLAIPASPTPATSHRCLRPDGGVSFFAAPFGPIQLQIPTPEGTLVAARTSDYRLVFFGHLSDTVKTIERSINSAPVTDADWTAALADWNDFHRQWPTATCDGDGFPRPPMKPVLASLFFDDVARLWVELATPDGPRYDVYDEGTLIATVGGLPASGAIDPSVRGTRIAMAGTDASGAPVVRVYRFRM